MELMFLSFDDYNNNHRSKIKSYLENKKLIGNESLVSSCDLIESTYNDEFSKSEKIRIFNSIFCVNGGIELQFEPLKEEIDSGKCCGYFIHLDGELIGSSDISIYGEFIYLMNFGLLEEFRGCGLSKLFLSYLIDDAIDKFSDKYNGIHLTVRDSNFVAKSLYNSFGFVRKI